MSHLQTARSMFGTNMAVHIIFATLGVGLPLMILVAEILYQKRKDRDYAIMANRWTKGLGVLLGVSIPTGTIAGTQLTLLWPGFMEVIGKVMSLPFQIEIYAFFVEALFMSLYVYAADRLKPWMRIFSIILVLLGAFASAVLITDVHSFESTPAGFKLVNGEVTDVHPWEAFFNPSFYVTAGHVAVSAFATGAFVIAAIASYKMIRQRKNARIYAFHKKALLMSLVVGGVFSLLTALNGHETAQHLYREQPEKLAAAEGLFNTTDHAPLAIGGFTDKKTEEVKYAIEIPWALSFLADNRFDTKVKGLNEFPKEDWPPLFVHTLFNTMVFIGSLMILLAVVGIFWEKKLKRKFPRWLLWLNVLAGPLSIISIEAGWIFSCTGRQPWIIYHMMRTSEAVTTATNLGVMFGFFLLVYVILSISVVLVLFFYFRRNSVQKALEKDQAKRQTTNPEPSNAY